MRGYSHALAGAAATLAVAPWVAAHPSPARIIVMAVVGAGAGLGPDVDHRAGTIAQTFGWPTKLLCRAVGKLSGGHRHATHSLAGAFIAGVIAWIVCRLGGIAGSHFATGHGTTLQRLAPQAGQYLVAILGLGLGLDGLGYTRTGPIHSLASFTGCTAFVIGTALAGVTYDWVPAVWVVGSLAHLATDGMTQSGIPIAWPLTWRRFRIASFDTGKWPERFIVAPLLIIMIIMLAVWRLGWWPPIIHAATTAAATSYLYAVGR